MPKKKANVLVTSRECRGNHERMIRRFIKKTKKEKIIEQIKDKRYYKKPSVKKREDRAKAERKRIRDELKRQRALERRNRKKR
jgi:small subunit ribosomal protein S21